MDEINELGLIVAVILLFVLFGIIVGEMDICCRNIKKEREIKELYTLQVLEQKIEKTREKIIQVIKEKERLFLLTKDSQNRQFIPKYLWLKDAEWFLRRDYADLIRKYNQRVNINYSLLGSTSLAAQLHLKNEFSLENEGIRF
jgi:hypothetical protein